MLPLVLALVAQPAPATTPPAAPLDWKSLESPYLSGQTQLTLPEKYLKAGEAYFDHGTPPKWVVFQAVERPKGDTKPSPHYAMYVAPLKSQMVMEASDDGKKCRESLALGEAIRISNEATANTCAWFVPPTVKSPLGGPMAGMLIYGSTLIPPFDAGDAAPGYSKDRSRYTWQFPPEMKVVYQIVPEIARNVLPEEEAGIFLKKFDRVTKPTMLMAPPNGDGYAAECSYAPDGTSVLFTYLDPKTKNPDLWVYDVATGVSRPLVQADGYDGGPFFSPDGKWITYRSDRKGDNNLQLFVAELMFDDMEPTKIVGIRREVQLTGFGDDEKIVSWCPYWHPSMKYLVYATSAVSHGNYEVFALEFDAAKVRAFSPSESAKAPSLRRARITSADGFDGLPVFSDDGSIMMWTSQRGPKVSGEAKPSSQLWIGSVTGEPAWTK